MKIKKQKKNKGKTDFFKNISEMIFRFNIVNLEIFIHKFYFIFFSRIKKLSSYKIEDLKY